MADKIGLKDIASHFGVSITTVSKALNGHNDISEKMRAEIIAYANEVNYIPNLVAKNFRQKRTNIIGIVLNNYANPYNSRMMHGIETYLTARDYIPIFMDHHGDKKLEQDMIYTLRALNAAGIILAPAMEHDENVEIIRKSKVPYVLVREFERESQDAYVTVDDEQIGYMAVKYLYSYQNPHLFFLNGPIAARSSRLRLEGCLRAVRELGVDLPEDHIYSDCRNSDDGYRGMREIISRYKPPYSVVCYSDYIAAGTITALQERRVAIPYDAAVIGADNINILSYMKPRLTTLDLPKKRLGEKAAEILVDLISQKDLNPNNEFTITDDHRVVFRSNLLIRETC